MQRLIRRLSFIALSVLVILLIGTAGFILIEDFPPFDAFYMSLTTIATVGYAEIRPLGLRGRIFNTFLILVGVTTILVAIGAITQSVIEIEIGEILGRRRNKRMIDKLEG
ncbi:MAG: two pore domain potassium channel family protein, partial [Acidobacteria bacterium]|nr:two pore domain potassium channel family protein [Acidobacteriota bacterium]